LTFVGRSELNLSKHLASELMRKLCEDGCVSDFSYKFKGRLVNAERVRHVIVQLQAMIYGMTSKYDEEKKRKRCEEKNEELPTSCSKVQKIDEST
jgi:hypothetical protein